MYEWVLQAIGKTVTGKYKKEKFCGYKTVYIIYTYLREVNA